MDSGSNGDITFHLAVPSLDVAIDPSNGAWGHLYGGLTLCVAPAAPAEEGALVPLLTRPAVAREADVALWPPHPTTTASRMPVPPANNPNTLPDSLLALYTDSVFVPSQGLCSPSDQWNLMPTSPPWNWWWRPVTAAPPASHLGQRFSFRCLM